MPRRPLLIFRQACSLKQMIERLDEIVMARTETHVPRVSIGDAAAHAVNQMSSVMARGGKIGGITTGLTTLDDPDGWPAPWRIGVGGWTPWDGQDWPHAVLCPKDCGSRI